MIGRRALAVLAAAGLLSAGCGPAGSGVLATRERPVPVFESVVVSEGIDLYLELAPGLPQRVSITYDDNLIDRIATDVADGELSVEIGEPFRVTGGGRFVEVTAAGLKELRAESGADVRVEGSVEELTVTASGGASLDLSLLEARRIRIDASGGAFVAVRATEWVRGSATAGAEVMVLGEPASVDVAVAGGASLVRP